jgi:protocatechuate 3,4-dioxygenase beta subunit
VLGIKGTLSVVGLKTLKFRLQQGREAKAQRGELGRLLAPGYVMDPTGKPVRRSNGNAAPGPPRRPASLSRRITPAILAGRSTSDTRGSCTATAAIPGRTTRRWRCAAGKAC